MSNGQLNGYGSTAKNMLDGIQCALEAGEIAVHPIQDECARLIVFGGVVPNSFGADLDTSGSVEHDQRGVGGDERGFCFVDEGGVAGRIEEIYFYFFRQSGRLPFGECEAGVDGNFSRNFFFVPVGGG